MTERDHEKLRRLFDLASAVSAGEREALLARECGGDAELKQRLMAMIAAVEDDHLLAEPTAGVGAPVENDAAAETVASATREHAGHVIDRYKLLQPIGEGGFGTVWMAEQREPVKRRVALKIIKLGMDTKQVIARFEAERQALAMMDHPNIAKVLDAGSTDTGRPYFAMELVRGIPVLEYCDTEKMDTKGRLCLFVLICKAIQHAHHKGIIHRDIKPSNVLVTLHDGVPVPKVIDFGIAKATNAELTNKTLFTEHRQMIGTPAYMSPEQAEVSGLDIDTRSDVYSLGVLLYELLTGTTPFAARDLMKRGFAEMMRVIREEEPHKPSTRLSTLGETGTRTALQRRTDVKKLNLMLRGDLDWIVMKCLEKDRTRRYETANGLAADIKRHLDDEPVVAGPPSAGYRLRKFVMRNRGQVIAGGVVAAVLILGVVGTTLGMLWAIDERARVVAQAKTASEAMREAANRLVETFDEMAQETGDTTLRVLPIGDPAEYEGMEVDGLGIATKNLATVFSQSLKEEARLRQQAERELARATEIKRLITKMFQNVAPRKAKGADTTLLKGILDGMAKRLAAGKVTDELIAAELHHVVGNVYKALGQYPESERHLSMAVEIRTRGLSAEHADTLLSINDLASLYQRQGRFAEAEPLLVETLETRRRVLGEEHTGTLRSISNLANLYAYRGRYAEAEPLYERTLEIRRRVLGEERPDTLLSMGSLANMYQFQGRYAEAETLLVKTLEIMRRVLGEEHPNTLVSMHNLAVLFKGQRRFAEAEPLSLKTLEIRRRVLGEEHPQTLGSMYNLASLYLNQGRSAEAEPLYLKTLETQRRVLGEEHPSTLGTISSLGILCNSMERYEDAAAMFETSLPILRRVRGMQHPETWDSMRGLAKAYLQLGRRNDALPLVRELFTLQTAAAEAPDADANTLNEVAWTLLTYDIEELRDPTRALAYSQRACDSEEAAGGGNLWKWLDTLALARQRIGDTAAAVETQRRALSLMAPDHADRADYEKRLAEYEAAIAGRDSQQPNP
jgi:tetratricopeptide (TPR) repeat protein/tRNA A-37 threonylcarbamoyl transferase component Bud32